MWKVVGRAALALCCTVTIVLTKTSWQISTILPFLSLCLSLSSPPPTPPVSLASAGIGRTGVLITMETAMCLMECSQPVYPLDIVRTMRDQRAMMIQTPVSRLSTHSHTPYLLL